MRGLGSSSSPFTFIIDPVLYKIGIIIIKECSLNIHIPLALDV